MRLFEAGNWRDRKPATWIPMNGAVKTGEYGYRPSAFFFCPDCGMAVGLWNHRISENGEVSPSVVCPSTKNRNGVADYCRFHDFLVLKDWKAIPYAPQFPSEQEYPRP